MQPDAIDTMQWHESPLFQRMSRVLIFVVGLLVFGTFGYVLIEGWPVIDGFFMTVITLSTVGYGETQTLTEAGRWFTSILIFMCLFTMTCWSAVLTSFFVEGDMSGKFVRRRTLKMISKLSGHTVVCGTSLLAEAVIEQLVRARKAVVVIDEDKERLEEIKRRYRRLHIVEGAPTSDLALANANVLQAGSVVAAMPNEIDNLLVGISCKDIGCDIAVYARSNDASVANRMRKAGVDEVISPHLICGSRIAEMILA